MKFVDSILRTGFVATFALSLWGCIDAGSDCKKLKANLYLCRFEDHRSFYLQADPAKPLEGGGLVDGTILSIGVTDRCVAAQRYASFRGDPDGWMLFDSNSMAPRGPYPEAQFRADRVCGSTPTKPVAQAWASLRR